MFYKCKFGLALRYSADMFINMLKTELNEFLQNGFKYRKISQLFEKFSRKSKTNAFNSFICRRENVTADRVVSKTKDSKTKTEARSTQISKTKHPKLENEAP